MADSKRLQELESTRSSIERMPNVFEDEDHERGCPMRYAACECGYDEKIINRGAELERKLSASSASGLTQNEQRYLWLREQQSQGLKSMFNFSGPCVSIEFPVKNGRDGTPAWSSPKGDALDSAIDAAISLTESRA